MKISNDLTKVVDEHKEELLCKENVVGVGAGCEKRRGKNTGKEAVVVLVREKKPIADLGPEDVLPDIIDGKVVDVIEVGDINIQNHRQKYRPLVPGISAGHFGITAGTLGLFVVKDGNTYALSNNHVFANSNNCEIGDAIYQPGPADGGRVADTVAHLAHYVPIQFGGADNFVDAALARVIEPEPIPEPEPIDEDEDEPTTPAEDTRRPCAVTAFFVSSANAVAASLGRKARIQAYFVEDDGTPFGLEAFSGSEYSNATLNMPAAISGIVRTELEAGEIVQKSGRTTGYTQGEVLAIGATVNVGFGSSGPARFVDQIVCSNMSAGGDSGSAVFDMNGHLVGLLFAGSATVTILNRIGYVFDQLGIDNIY